ncbi:MAG TPA: host attachment protein [Gammaproteobacteria bacterium]|nr:host attachment protein [Gammaproteobacteria bacterium]
MRQSRIHPATRPRRIRFLAPIPADRRNGMQNSRQNTLHKTWVVVADGSRARFFSREGQRVLHEFEVLVAPDNRLEEHEQVSDRPGRIETASGGIHSLGSRNAARQHAFDAFARRVAGRIDEGRKSGGLDRLVLVAAPRFLGRLRAHLSEQSAALVAVTVDKALTQLSPDRLVHHLPDFLR